MSIAFRSSADFLFSQIATAPPTPTVSTATSTIPAAATAQPTPQYRYPSTADDQQLIAELQTGLMESKPMQMTPVPGRCLSGMPYYSEAAS